MGSFTLVKAEVHNKPVQEIKEEAFLYDLIDIGMKSGRFLFFGNSYTVRPSHLNGSDFTVKNHWGRMYLLKLLHILFFLYVMVPFTNGKLSLSSCCLINLIKKGLFTVIITYVMVSHFCVEIKGRRLDGSGIVPIYRQCLIVQKKFTKMGVHFPGRSKVKFFGWSICVAASVACLIRSYIFVSLRSPWYARHAEQFSKMMTLGMWAANNETVSENTGRFLGALGFGLDLALSTIWFFSQIIHFFFVATMWLVFSKLNGACESGRFELPDIMELHFQCTKLLKEINQLISPLTFWSIVANIVTLCFWTNYITVDFKLSPTYIVAVCNFLKIVVELLMEVNVNWKAHRITEWLEESCATTESFAKVDPVKLAVFTSQIYNQDSMGFRGLNYFVVTSKLAITVLGIVITYSVAVNQMCKLR